MLGGRFTPEHNGRLSGKLSPGFTDIASGRPSGKLSGKLPIRFFPELPATFSVGSSGGFSPQLFPRLIGRLISGFNSEFLGKLRSDLSANEPGRLWPHESPRPDSPDCCHMETAVFRPFWSKRHRVSHLGGHLARLEFPAATPITFRPTRRNGLRPRLSADTSWRLTADGWVLQ
jgi:hypothetical protein